jgi:hypothetical protein
MLVKEIEVEVEKETFPDIVVTPSTIDFGHLRAGFDIGEEMITIVNAGDEELSVDSIGLYGQSSGLILGPLSSTLIEPGQYVTVDLDYDPTTYEQRNTTVYIESNDPDEPVVSIPVSGFGDAPVINVDPAHTDFGKIEVGCDDETTITISNDGNLDLDLSGVSLYVTLPTGYSSTLSDTLPHSVAPGDQYVLELSYSPVEESSETSYIEIKSNDPVSPVMQVNNTGEGEYVSSITDSFEQEETNMVDVLFVVDNSGSMGQIQSDIATNMNLFMTYFSSMGADYRLALITTDTYSFAGSVITPATTDPAGEFANQVVGIGVTGSANEKGIEMAHNATQPGADAGIGGGFLRESAMLVIVFVSDEPDHSLASMSSYISHFDSIKNNQDKLIVHAVIGDYPSGCTYMYTHPYTGTQYPRTIQFGDGYYDLAQQYLGNVYSICATDWGTQMQSIAQSSVPLLSYSLSSEDVIEETIEVTIDGAVSSDWTYDEVENYILFDVAYAPADGSTIDVNYSIYGCQEEDTAANTN